MLRQGFCSMITDEPGFPVCFSPDADGTGSAVRRR